MLVMISPVPFLFSLSLFFFLSLAPLFFSLRSGFFTPFPLPPPPHFGLRGRGREEGGGE